ncbi:hypothetical protein BWK59_10495 [Flavobacterium davisii]|uniref:Uncharacterized protein n=1 Tax=Flavobacterium davisii TaxID=2906077 RepID=A0A246GIP7_9FLAO|nr:hypothetical protein [Flavobacterium davisii]OWP83439.1 hypothetical protein BWK59_10495 [Flavobacterium davisii]
MKTLYTLLIGLVLLSCSKKSEDETVKIFRFLEFENDVLLPNINESELTFLAIDFDKKIEDWEIKLSNGKEDFPTGINRIETTMYGWTNGDKIAQRIYLRIPKLEYGDYTVSIKNKKTNQIYTDVFLVRNKVFRGLKSVESTTYSIIHDTPDYLYFQNTTNSITNDPYSNTVKQVVLEDKTTMVSYSINFQVINNTIAFTIPKTIPQGIYYFSIKYTNGIANYHEKDIVILEQQLPQINSINKSVFNSGEELKLEGINFRYKIATGILPFDGLSNVQTGTYLVFKDIKNEYNLSCGIYENNNQDYNDISSSETKLLYKIPPLSKASIFTDANKTYFDGEVYVKSGPYKSNPIKVKVVY